MKKLMLAVVLLFIITPIQAQFTDVSKSDSDYPSIKESVDQGYMSPFGTEFRPDQTLSRREAALIVNRLIQLLDKAPQDLSEAERLELSKLAKTYKTQIERVESTLNRQEDDIAGLKTLTNDLQFDLTKTTSETLDYVDKFDQENKKQHKYMVVAIIIGAVLGIAF